MTVTSQRGVFQSDNALRVAGLLVLLSILPACGGGDGEGGRDPEPAPLLATPTARGESLDDPVTAIIGTAGGRLASKDDRLSITVPAGAFVQDIQVGIELISDMTRGGEATAYRLTPHGETFAAPITLTFEYSDDDMDGSAPQLLAFAFQREDGYWQVIEDVTLDTTANTVSVTTTHFSDWVSMSLISLTPHEAVVKVGESVALKVLNCVGKHPDDTSILAVVPGCGDMDELGFVVYGGEGWSVNGLAGGSASAGTVDANADTRNTYLAPSVKPESNTVAVSVFFNDTIINPLGIPFSLTSNITIVDDSSNGQYAGTLNYSQYGIVSATATLTWNLYEQSSSVSDYLPSGTITGTIASEDGGCDFSAPVEAGTAAETVSWMSVHTGIATFPWTNSHNFVLNPQVQNATMTCENVPVESIAALFVVSIGSMCAGNIVRVYQSDTNNLAGTWSCPDTLLTADWEFVKQ